MLSFSKSLSILSILAFTNFASTNEARVWTSTAGSQLNAEFVSKTGNTVRLRTNEGKEILLQLSQLIQEDQDFISTLAPENEDHILSRKEDEDGWYSAHISPGNAFLVEFELRRGAKVIVDIAYSSDVKGDGEHNGRAVFFVAYEEEEKLLDFARENRPTQEEREQGDAKEVGIEAINLSTEIRNATVFSGMSSRSNFSASLDDKNKRAKIQFENHYPITTKIAIWQVLE